MTQSNSDLTREFRRGEAAAMDPINEAVTQGGHAVTSLSSPWLHKRCRKCDHSFRPEDEVYIFSDGHVEHDSGLLPCKNGNTAFVPDSNATAAFFQGLDASWPTSADLPVVQLGHEHFLLAPAVSGFKRHACAVCGHTFRLHDKVIICPCQPSDSRCQVAVHRDPLHNRNCWSLWGVGEGQQLQYCLATSRKLIR